jgi:signal transduction histidine kinase
MSSIRWQLGARLLGGIVLVSMASGALLYSYVRKSLVGQLDASLAEKAQAIAHLVHEDEAGRLVLDEDDLAPGPEGAQGDLFEIWTEDGTSLARSRSLGSQGLPRRFSRDRDFWDMGLPGNRSGRAASLRLTIRPEIDEPPGADEDEPPKIGQPRVVWSAVARDRGPVDRALAVVLSGAVAATLLMAATAVVLVFFGIRSGLRPLRRLADEAAAANTDLLEHRFTADHLPRELEPIYGRLNDLLERLAAARRRERAFNANVAHELRTPLAELRAVCEVALKWPGEPEAQRRTIQEALDVALQMESLIGVLFALAHGNSGTVEAPVERFDLSRVAQSTWQALEGRARERRLRWSFDWPAGALVESRRALVASIVRNLLTNAVEYTPQGGEIQGRVTPRPGHLALSISNDADGLTAEDLPRLFEPFWRKDPSRSSRVHAGLGLSLVETYAALLGSEVRTELEAGQLRIELLLPTEASD